VPLGGSAGASVWPQAPAPGRALRRTSALAFPLGFSNALASTWRSAYVPPGKAESARALLSRIRCILHHRRKRSQKLSGINCVAATLQLTGRELATFDCPVDRRFGNACSPCCAVWCVHARYQCVALKTCCYRSHAVVKARLSYAAEQRRKRCQIAVAYAANALLPRDTSGICSVRLPPQPR
jgi:hypothetical protein